MSKATEDNKMIVTEKILLWEFNSYWKFMCTSENNGKNKTCVQIPSHSSYSFLNYCKTT